MNPRKNELFQVTLTALMSLSCAMALYGGKVTTTPPAVDAFGTVVIAPDGNVTFDASSSQGTVTIDQTFSSFAHGTPSYSGGGTSAIVDVTFTDDATGHDNSCTVVVNHTVPSLSGGGSQQCANERPISFNVIVPKVTFDSMSASSAEAPTLSPNFDPTTNKLVSAKLETGATISGLVDVAPTDGAPFVKLKLVQYGNAGSNEPNTDSLNGADSAFNGYATNYTASGATVSITASDYPGISAPATKWAGWAPDNVSFDGSFNDYMQWQIQGGTSWTTVGKATWGTHAAIQPFIDSNGRLGFHQPSGTGVNGSTGSEYSGDFDTPSSKNSY